MLLLVPAAASAAQDQQRLDRTVRYLQDVQHKDGGFGERGSNPSFSFWAAMALASAGINPRDQFKKPDGKSVYTYFTRHTDGLTQSTDYARLILVARAAGTSPRRFGPIDPVARLLRLQRARWRLPATADAPHLPDQRHRLRGPRAGGAEGDAWTHRSSPGLAALQAGRRRVVGGHRPDRIGDRGA